MLTRLIDLFKGDQVTTLFTSLTGADGAPEQTDVGISSLMDTWLLLRNLEYNGERNRALYVLKSRGMAHSNQIREFRLSEDGIELVDVYSGAGAVLTGTARAVQEANEKAEALADEQEVERLQRELKRKQQAADAQMAMIRSTLESEVEDLQRRLQQAAGRTEVLARDRAAMVRKRTADGEGRRGEISR